MEHDDAIVGCGGFYLDDSKTQAHLCWGMIHQNAQRQGLGRFLLLYRIREIGNAGAVERVSLQTSPAAATFYEKQGFKRTPPTHIHLVDMVMKLTVCLSSHSIRALDVQSSLNGWRVEYEAC